MSNETTRVRLRSIAFAFLLGVSACAVPAGMNDTCDWPARGRIGTLLADVRTAEELALRYADARFDSRAAHGRLRSDCEAKLFRLVAQAHGVGEDAVAAAREQLARNTFDPPVHIPLAIIYMAVAVAAARRIRRRFSGDEWVAVVISGLFASAGIGLVIVVLGHLWDGAVEMLRVGNMHMSYRAERLGFREHTLTVFSIALVLFWFGVLNAYRHARERE